MNKTDLINEVAQRTGGTKKSAEDAVNATLSAVSDALSKGEKVQLIGFGTFEVRERKAREGRNPSTGEVIQIPKQLTPVFKPGKSLKEQVK